MNLAHRQAYLSDYSEPECAAALTVEAAPDAAEAAPIIDDDDATDDDDDGPSVMHVADEYGGAAGGGVAEVAPTDNSLKSMLKGRATRATAEEVATVVLQSEVSCSTLLYRL